MDGLKPHTSEFDRLINVVATALFLGTLTLIFLGGTVTSKEAGMAVPDWPTTFGENMFTYPPSEWKGDVGFEHVHRLAGATIGFIAIVLAGVVQWRERRLWVRRFAWGLLIAVIIQGVMGGYRVKEDSLTLAMVHGCFAQLFLSASACMVLFTSRAWKTSEESLHAGGEPPAGGRMLFRLCVVNVVMIFMQLVAGAIYRHTGNGLMYHILGAVITTVMVSSVAMYVTGQQHDKPLLVRMATLLGGVFILQLALGVGAFIFTMSGAKPTNAWQWVVPSLHVVVGAGVLSASVVLTASVSRVLGGRAVDAEGGMATGITTT